MYSIGSGKRSKPIEIDGRVKAADGWYFSGDIECLVHVNRLKDPAFTTIPEEVLIQPAQTPKDPSIEDVKAVVKTHMQHASTIYKPLTVPQPKFVAQVKELTQLALETANATNSKKTLIISGNTTQNHYFTVALNTDGEILYVNSLDINPDAQGKYPPNHIFEELKRELGPVFGAFNKNIQAKAITDIRPVNGADCGSITTEVCSAIQGEPSLLSDDQIKRIRKKANNFTDVKAIRESIRTAHATSLTANYQHTPNLNYGNPGLVKALVEIDLRNCKPNYTQRRVDFIREDRKKFVVTCGNKNCKVSADDISQAGAGALANKNRDFKEQASMTRTEAQATAPSSNSAKPK
jgi:hypothetical protein